MPRSSEPRVVAAGAGAAWWGKGFHMLTSNFWTWIGIMLVYIIVGVLINIVPYVGSIGYSLLTPVFVGGLMIGCQAIERNEPLRVAHLFEGFQGTHFVSLMIIGGVNVALSLGLGALEVAVVPGGLKFADLSHMGTLADPFGALIGYANAITGTAMLTTLLILVIAAVFAMLNWFAPALVALRGASAVEAMKLSFLSCWRNWAPFLVYGLVAVGILFGAVVVIVLALTLYSPRAGFDVFELLALFAAFAVVGFFIGLVAILFIGPIVFGSWYAGYKDTLGANDIEPGVSA